MRRREQLPPPGAGKGWLPELGRELDRVGIRGRARRGIELELADHLACDPDSESRLGSPRQVAEIFAADLGSVRTKRAAYGSFAAVALVAMGMLATTTAHPIGGSAEVHGVRGVVAPLAGLAVLVAAQIALVAGLLGIVRALRIRRLGPRPGELRLVQRRMAAATGAAAALSIATIAQIAAYWGATAARWDAAALAATLVPAAALAAARLSVRRAEVVTHGAGSAEGLSADLPAWLASHAEGLVARPSRLALLVGVPICALVLAGGSYAERSFQEGLERAVVEAVAFAGSFLVLGRRLAIRP